jgi:ABC-type sugar transport system substrate-binding protein
LTTEADANSQRVCNGNAFDREFSEEKKIVRHWTSTILIVFLAFAMMAVGIASAQDSEIDVTAYGETLDADPAILIKAFGTDEGVPAIALAAFARAGVPVEGALLDKALECWREQVCDTGTGGDIVLGIADGWRVNQWREFTHMEAILQALTYPEIGRIIYSDAQGDTQKAISDLRALIAQEVDLIVGYPDAGDALLPAVREATERGIPYIPYSYGMIGEPGTDYPTFVGEDVCQLGRNFAAILNEEVGTGKVAFLGGTPGNALSAAWQACEEEDLGDGLTLIGKADTNWSPAGVTQAVSGFLSTDPDLAGISYEYAGGFLGGVQAYEAAGLPMDIVLTLRTDETGLFCEWLDMNNPNFRIFYSAAGNPQARVAVTAGMMALQGAELPSGIIVPLTMREADESSCIRDVPSEYATSSLVPLNVVEAMYPPAS